MLAYLLTWRKQRGRVYTLDNRLFSVKQGGRRCFGGFERIADIAAFLRGLTYFLSLISVGAVKAAGTIIGDGFAFILSVRKSKKVTA